MRFFETYPGLVAILWPLLTALITSFFKPRTPEEYAALPPRLAAFLRLVGALGLDVPKAAECLSALIKGVKK